MEIPIYTQDPETGPVEQNYQQQLNLTLSQNLGDNGFVITAITDADLRTNTILDPNTGLFTTVAALMPIGTIWALVDDYEPNTTTCIWVGKNGPLNTNLVQFTTSAYP